VKDRKCDVSGCDKSAHGKLILLDVVGLSKEDVCKQMTFDACKKHYDTAHESRKTGKLY